MLAVWILRLVLLAVFLPLLIPMASAFIFTPIHLALLLLALALLSLAAVLGWILGVLGTLVDVLLIAAAIGLFWHWPRGLRASVPEKLRLAYRGMRNTLCSQLRHCSATDSALCLAVVLIAVVISLASGVLHFLLTITVVLLIVGVIWKWPRSPHLPLARKLRFALRALWEDLRKRFRH